MPAPEHAQTDHLSSGTLCAPPDELVSFDGVLEHAFSEAALRKIRGVVRQQMQRWQGAREEDVEDVVSDTVVALLGRSPASEDIADAEAYTAAVARRMCSAWLRKRYPNFHRLRVRLRYLLAQEPRFALWEAASGDTVCGFRDDAGGATVACAETLTGECPRSVSPGDTLAFLFRASGGPLRLNDLARVCAAVWGVHDGVAEMQEDIAATAAAPSAEDLHHRRQLTALWAEIRELPPRQAAALLLNLRADDGECATSLLVLTGTASLRELASVTNVPAEEFAELWKRLPLSDLEIAERLGLSRQQVINLRKCARERLRRRMGDL